MYISIFPLDKLHTTNSIHSSTAPTFLAVFFGGDPVLALLLLFLSEGDTAEEATVELTDSDSSLSNRRHCGERYVVYIKVYALSLMYNTSMGMSSFRISSSLVY